MSPNGLKKEKIKATVMVTTRKMFTKSAALMSPNLHQWPMPKESVKYCRALRLQTPFPTPQETPGETRKGNNLKKKKK
jgi:hypothetical protein